ncbi:hypothetical protein V6N11_057231 [Hibiscus sabdariffa]|uniref:Uncharacterized protein n=2 Tax=Hibiscus sabdariffa TaxID=183260 RepID=A0ABR2B3W0_9ROSI
MEPHQHLKVAVAAMPNVTVDDNLQCCVWRITRLEVRKGNLTFRLLFYDSKFKEHVTRNGKGLALQMTQVVADDTTSSSNKKDDDVQTPMVRIIAFQAIDPCSTPGKRIIAKSDPEIASNTNGPLIVCSPTVRIIAFKAIDLDVKDMNTASIPLLASIKSSAVLNRI